MSDEDALRLVHTQLGELTKAIGTLNEQLRSIDEKLNKIERKMPSLPAGNIK